MTQRKHRQQGGIARLIAKVVFKLTTGELGAALRLGRNKLSFLTLKNVVTHEGEGQTTKVTTATEASNHLVGIFARHLHLLFGLKTYHRLV